MRTEVRAPDVLVAPGRQTAIEVEIANTSTVIDGVTARIEGLDPSWVHLPSPVLSLFPETTGVLPVQITFPPDAVVGEYPVIVHIESTIDPSRHERHELWLQVPPVESATLTMRPSVVTKGGRATVTAIVSNTGNVETDFTMSALDETRALDCAADPLTLTVAPGTDGTAEISLRGKRPWFGQMVTRKVEVAARSSTLDLTELVTFNQKPRIPRGALTIALLAAIVALWATILLVGVELFRGSDDPTKAVAANFNEGGAQDVPLLAVAGTMSGTATASSTGDGIERVTVEAFRLDPDGNGELTASAATDEEGTYSLAPLLPGSYKLRFTADGYDEVWYPDAAGQPGAEEVDLEPTAELEGIGAELAGGSGTLVGDFLLPDSADPDQPVTVTITQLVEQAEGDEDAGGGEGGDAAALPEPIVAQITDTLVVSDLVTPATYRIQAEAEGFQPVEIEEALVGGETKVLDAVRLSSAGGSISGTVVTSGGTLLGGVEVTISSGEVEKQATTATTGNVGAFTVEGLETPRTYVLAFDHETFGSQTSALDLGPGEIRTGVEVVLTGGTGTVAGRATDAGGNPLGDVEVTVSGAEFDASTSTLSSSSADASVGSYRIGDVPTPGVYAVTFSAEGYESETVTVGFLEPSVQSDVSVALGSSDASITGQVRGGDGAVPGAEVELSDGVTTLTTTTASSPPGGFSFTDVEPGTYTLTADAPGRPRRIVLVRVGAGEDLSRDITLRSGG